ncbi:HAD family hydrolase [Geobacter argillaceus]|uniref:Beta-phosphoglucomutase n=1 Tax=Geobacter argillaceus TaxID=345631 RepID=A0A562VGS4_9BACT|nr:HAD family phosphatase [Geobacter argillaceus]TWJ17078.1 beta-phosphoglucomutase [Geobacter argillaceus]
MLKAVIFDFDGIIVDTEPLHYRAFQEILEPLGLGYSWDEYVARYMGFDDRDAFVEAFAVAGRQLSPEALEQLIDRKARIFQEVIASGVTPYPGVVRLATELAGEVPVALCSGALPSDILPILSQFSLDKVFAVVVTASDVAASKPDPASYRLAVERLQAAFPTHGIAPSSCLAIEDTPAGIASANGAGVRVVAVTNSYPADRLLSASKVVDSLAGETFATLNALVSG